MISKFEEFLYDIERTVAGVSYVEYIDSIVRKLEFVSLYIKYISFIGDVLDVKKDLQSQRPCRIVRGRSRMEICRELDVYGEMNMCMRECASNVHVSINARNRYACVFVFVRLCARVRVCLWI